MKTEENTYPTGIVSFEHARRGAALLARATRKPLAIVVRFSRLAKGKTHLIVNETRLAALGIAPDSPEVLEWAGVNGEPTFSSALSPEPVTTEPKQSRARNRTAKPAQTPAETPELPAMTEDPQNAPEEQAGPSERQGGSLGSMDMGAGYLSRSDAEELGIIHAEDDEQDERFAIHKDYAGSPEPLTQIEPMTQIVGGNQVDAVTGEVLKEGVTDSPEPMKGSDLTGPIYTPTPQKTYDIGRFRRLSTLTKMTRSRPERQGLKSAQYVV